MVTQIVPGTPTAPGWFDASEIAYEAKNAGFNGEQIVTAIAIAFAESKGDINAFNDNGITRDLSYGLWQINMYGGLGPIRRKEFGITDNKQLFGATINARAAKKIFDSQGWQAWSTYKVGKHIPYIPAAIIGAQNPKQGNSSSAGETVTVEQIDMLKPLKDLTLWLMKTLSPFTIRVAAFVGGGVLILVALMMYVKSQISLRKLGLR